MDTVEQFYLAKKGQTEPIGPFSLPALQSMAKAGMLSTDYLYAVEGMQQWEPLTSLQGLVDLKSAYQGERPNSHIVLSLLLTLCCFPPTALVAVYYALKVNRLYNGGEVVAARECADTAATWCIATLFCGIVAWVWVL